MAGGRNKRTTPSGKGSAEEATAIVSPVAKAARIEAVPEPTAAARPAAGNRATHDSPYKSNMRHSSTTNKHWAGRDKSDDSTDDGSNDSENGSEKAYEVDDEKEDVSKEQEQTPWMNRKPAAKPPAKKPAAKVPGNESPRKPTTSSPGRDTDRTASNVGSRNSRSNHGEESGSSVVGRAGSSTRGSLFEISVQDLRRYIVEESKFLRRQLPNETQILTLKDLLEDNFNRNEQYVLVGTLYRINHHRRGLREGQDDSRYDRNRRGRKANREYDRMFMFISLDGQVFCYIAGMAVIGRQVMSRCRNNMIGVGATFVLVGPSLEGRNFLGNDTCIVKTMHPLIPLKPSFAGLLPTLQMVDSEKVGHESGFCFHKVKLTLGDVVLITKYNTEKASCQGCLCDRKMPFDSNLACGCFDIANNQKVPPVVLQYTVEGKNTKKIPKAVVGERSLRSTLLFIENVATLGLLSYETLLEEHFFIRSAVKSCVDYINESGGFTVIGIVVKGGVPDASAGASGTRLSADSDTIHISYLYPTRTDIPQSQEYMDLKYKWQERQVTAQNSSSSDASH